MKNIITGISEMLLQTRGIDVIKYEQSFLKKSILKRMTETLCASFDEYYIFLMENEEEPESLVSSLHNNYSEFFCNPLTFAVLERVILPSILLTKKNKKQNELRIWSAACAGGQEAYSLAILLEELMNGSTNKFKYRIFATDRSVAQVNKARLGTFSAGELGNVTIRRVEKWFVEQGEVFTVKPEIKVNIDFSVFNLFNEALSTPPASIFGGFDLVFCANLLFYYNNDYRKIIVNKIHNSLAEKGFLVTGETEREIFMSHNYYEEISQSCIFRIRD